MLKKLMCFVTKEYVKNALIFLCVAAVFAGPRLYNNITMSNDASSLEKITISISKDEKANIENFGKDTLNALNTKVPEKYKDELYEAFSFIAFAAYKEAKNLNKYYTAVDSYSNALVTLYNFAKTNNNKMSLVDILRVAETIKIQRKEYWKEFIDSQEDNTKEKLRKQRENDIIDTQNNIRIILNT